MHECLLCRRDMKVSNDIFGNGCIKNIYSFLDLKMPKKVKLREETLYKNVMELTSTHSINKNQKLWLTDRYLTYQYLNRIPYGNYNTFKAMQYAFWQTVIETGGKYAEFPISADFLQHSLEKEPEDLVITEGKVVQEILNDKSFKNNINDIVNKYGNECDKFVFDSLKDDSFPMNFNDKDLYFSIHSSELYIEGKKINGKWNLEVKLHDRYDYSKPKNLIKYYNDTSSIAKSIFSSTLYNLASFSIKCGVMKEYDIDIKIHIEEFEVM